MRCFNLYSAEDGRDRFFLYAMIILPFIASSCYVFDAWYHYIYHPESRNYEGLLSTIVIVFTYLQYCAPIRSRYALGIYHILLWIITEIANLGYLIFYIQERDTFRSIIYFSFLILHSYLTVGLLYCRVLNDFKSNIIVENKHLFHFISRLEVILTIYIPIYMKIEYTSLTRNTIAYFLLFDFFSDSYHRFQGVWIKSALYLFVATVTAAVATEWFYFNNNDHIYEAASLVAEVISAFLCNTIIILQFFPFHFKTQHIQHIFREAIISMKNQHNNKTQEPDDSSSTNMSMIYEENLYRY
ncbi:unnamed protein product [Rotaria socialis]|uniref:Uncharacterized protein n=2 Tax=Rotaria socialis TaxID=392032 RepID=A0A820JZP9_9BILA|nr:unnamed protein product [Rotaria socialis]CAF4331972.1 unnamed protein product [Rotaria socialis]